MIIIAHELGFRIVTVGETTSTNDLAKQYAKHSPEGLVIRAARQTQGRGRRGRVWHSEPGGLYFSILLKPKLPPAELAKITLVAGVTIVEVLRRRYDLPAELKWPNDVVITGKKVAGILCEGVTHGSDYGSVIVGIGINTNQKITAMPEKLRATAGSLEYFIGSKLDNNVLLQHILRRFGNNYRRLLSGNSRELLSSAREYTTMLGKTVQVITETQVYTGKACDLSEHGALIIENADGSRHELWSADISIRVETDPAGDLGR
ncbi:MAG: biotin--[acetyl-CoA-carboxylase] ligase [Firmicutes bacterium]|nr:biotin--[acetyl-CoA-carboxylase] ligase [Bacillota bacterium]NLL88430.1 biotin--[acetyl-CoA-carboxylase] ligase [Bacillota bacterium]HKM17538.1 biotin--[acetyl-CoA-carboxylase] ligase [Limnochordia bacterium]